MVSMRDKAFVRYLGAGAEAIRGTATELSSLVTASDLVLREMSGKIDAAWAEGWKSERDPPDGGWDWPLKRTQYQYISALKLAMWCDRETVLCGLMLSRLNNTACVIDFLEGNPHPKHPLKGKVTLLGLDVATRYAQITGRKEVWVNNPANERLIELYRKVYSFEYVRPKLGAPFCRRVIP